MARGRGAEIVILLDPPELGRIRIAFAGLDAQLSAQVTAERADVADQLRRHGEMLADALRQAGFADVDLAFDHGSDGAEAGDAPAIPLADPGRPADDQTRPAQAWTGLAVAPGRLDIRL